MQSSSLAVNVIIACWLLFLVVWAAGAASTKREVYRESWVQRLRYWIFLATACFLLIRGHRLPYPLNAVVIPHTEATVWTSAVLCIAGLAFTVWARVTLGRNWSGVVTLKEGHELIQRGPYQLVRHPIYTGLMTMFLATVIARGHVAAIVGILLLFVSFWIKLGDEEELMLKEFPDQYSAYQQRVKRIIPFLL